MVIFTTKLSKTKLIAIVAAAAAIVLLLIFMANRNTATGTITTAAGTKLATPEARVEFLASCGYTVSATPVKTQEVLIPKEWNEVYEQYAALQSSQGFELKKYKGKKVMQYVYLVENWPEESSDPVYATLLVYKDKLIGGELTRGGENGFLRPLLST